MEKTSKTYEIICVNLEKTEVLNLTINENAFFLSRPFSKKYVETSFQEDLLIKINYNIEGVIESLILIRNHQDKFEMTHSNSEILEEIAEKLKFNVKIMDVEKHFKNLGNLWIENSISLIKVKNIYNKKTYAMKTLSKENSSDILSQILIQNEIKVLKSLNHPNLLKFTYAYETHTSFHLVFDSLDGCILTDYIEKNGPLTCQEIAIILEVIFELISYFRKNEIIHRDITPFNILITSERIRKENVFLVGFKNSIYFKDFSSHTQCLITPGYIAPEFFNFSFLNSEEKFELIMKSDYFSLGITLYYLLFENIPYFSTNSALILKANQKRNFKFSTSAKFKFFEKDILQFLEKNQKKRFCGNDPIELQNFLFNLSTYDESSGNDEFGTILLRNNLDALNKWNIAYDNSKNDRKGY